MIVDKIVEFIKPNSDKEINTMLLDEYLDELDIGLTRQIFKVREERNTLRLSGIGKCLRAQAYTIHKAPKPPIQPRNKLVFLFGDIVEALIVCLAKHAGVQLTDEQKEVELNGVKGHIDGIVKHRGKRYLFECKSMSTASFDMFKRNGMSNDWGYVSQANSYAYTLNLDGIIWVGMNKDTSELYEEVRDIDFDLVNETKHRIKVLKNCKSPEEFERLEEIEYETFGRKTKKNDMDNRTGNILLPVVCSYCDYTEVCYGDKVTKILRKGKIKSYIGDIIEGEWTASGKVIT